MMKIPLFKIYWDDADIDSVNRVIKRGNYWATGPEIDHLEKAISKFIGTKYAVSFNSGTSALHADLLAHKITEGEVIIPSFTFIATANAVVLAGARPVFADIEKDTFGLDSEARHLQIFGLRNEQSLSECSGESFSQQTGY